MEIPQNNDKSRGIYCIRNRVVEQSTCLSMLSTMDLEIQACSRTQCSQSNVGCIVSTLRRRYVGSIDLLINLTASRCHFELVRSWNESHQYKSSHVRSREISVPYNIVVPIFKRCDVPKDLVMSASHTPHCRDVSLGRFSATCIVLDG
jgi:hypothetical protein